MLLEVGKKKLYSVYYLPLIEVYKKKNIEENKEYAYVFVRDKSDISCNIFMCCINLFKHNIKTRFS